MAKAKKPTKKFMNKVHHIVETDIFQSIAIVSVLLNILFLICVVLFTNTSTFNHGVYKAAKNRYCRNVSAVRERADELGSEQAAIDEWQINCIGDKFKPFYQEALEKFNAQNN